MRPRIYLAGPAVFLPDAPKILAGMAKIVAAQGLEPIIPAIDVDFSGLAPLPAARAIRHENCRRIVDCDGLIACVSPFRGPLADPGTTWEIGYASALDKKITLWREHPEGDMFAGHAVAVTLAEAARLLAARFG